MTGEMYAGSIIDTVHTAIAKIEIETSDIIAIVKQEFEQELSKVEPEERPVLQAFLNLIKARDNID